MVGKKMAYSVKVMTLRHNNAELMISNANPNNELLQFFSILVFIRPDLR